MTSFVILFKSEHLEQNWGQNWDMNIFLHLKSNAIFLFFLLINLFMIYKTCKITTTAIFSKINS